MLSYVTIEITTSSSMVHIASYDLSRCQRLSNLSMDQTDLLLRPKVSIYAVFRNERTVTVIHLESAN